MSCEPFLPAVPSCVLDPLRAQFLALLPRRIDAYPLGGHRRRELRCPSVRAVSGGWAADHAAMNANDLTAMLDTWQIGDVGRDRPGGYAGALQSIRARTVVMPSTTDAYFRWRAPG